MTGAALLDLLARSLVLLAAVGLAVAAIRRAGGSAAMRHLAWLLGFAGLAALPLLAAAAPALPLPLLPAGEPLAAATAQALPGAPPGQASRVSVATIVQLIYLTVAAGLLARPFVGRILLARMWRAARPVDDPELLHLLDALARQLGIRRRVAVRIASRPTVPMTWGVVRPRILLPAEARRWSREQRRFVLLHELGHVARRDSAGLFGAAVLCALYWANPAVWLAAERLRREQEHACDDLVLANGAEAATYARNLLGAARSLRGCDHAMAFAAAMVRPSELERRLRAIVGDPPRRRPQRAFIAASALATLGVTTLAAVAVPVETTARRAERPGIVPAARAHEAPPAAPIVVRAPAPVTRAAASLPATAVVANSHRRRATHRANPLGPPPVAPAAPVPPVPALPALPAVPALPPIPPVVDHS